MTCIGVTGAAGFLGSALCKIFAERGLSVVALCRRPGRARLARSRRFDLAEPLEAALLSGIDVLVHAAHDLGTRSGVESPNLEGSRRLIAAAKASGIERIVFVSSMAAAADSTSRYGREKYAIEQMLDPATDLIVRPGLIVGDGGLFRALYKTAARYRVAPVFAGGLQPVYVVGVGDLCSAIADLTASRAHGIHTIAHPEAVPMSQLYRAFAKKSGKPVLLLPLPMQPVLSAVILLERLGVKLPLDSERLNGLKNLRPQTFAPPSGLRSPLSALEPLMESLQIT